MLKSLVNLLLESKYQVIIGRKKLVVSSLYIDFNVSRSVFDIFWDRGGDTDLTLYDVKHGKKVDMRLWFGKLYDKNNWHHYSNHPNELPFDRFGDICNISELVEQNITDLFIIRFPGSDITQILTDLIDIKTCFKVYNITDIYNTISNKMFNRSIIEKLKTNMILYSDIILFHDDVFKLILQQNKTILNYVFCDDEGFNFKDTTNNVDPKLYKFITDLNPKKRSNFAHYLNRSSNLIGGASWDIRKGYKTYNSIKHIPRKLKEYQCVVRSCLEGYEPVYGQQIHSIWDEEFGWVSCKKCDQVSPKTILGTTFCACPRGTIPRNNFSNCYFICEYNTEVVNKSGSKCFHQWKKWLVEVSLLLTLIGLLLVIFVVLMFYKYRKTPIILSCNRKITVLQLTYHVMLFLEPLLLLLAPSKLLCGVHTVLVGHMITMLMSVIVARSQSRLYIFNHKGRLTTEDLLTLKAIEIFTMLIVNCLYAMLAVLLIATKDVIEGDVIDGLEIINAVCATVQTQGNIVFFIVLAVVCCIQACRTRNLPSVYTETTVILISMCFTSVFAGINLVSLFIKDLDKRHLCGVLFTYFVNFTLVIVIFGINVYWIVFRPDINSKKNFRLSVMRYVEKSSSLPEGTLSSSVIVK